MAVTVWLACNTQVRALESSQDEAIVAFAKAWIRMVETRPHVSQLVAVTDAGWNVTQVHRPWVFVYSRI